MSWSAAADAGDVGEAGWYDDSEDDFGVEALVERAVSAPAIAGGGREKDISREERRELSLPGISVEDAGVGGRPGRGMATVSVLDGLVDYCRVMLACSSRRMMRHS